ncbi:single-strand DNA-binding protein [Rhodoligotrophos appendicifer]|uniref:single-stranded DNA-binding protein n=1 Tax=Rhodoligotrophos appendicifer TaxID=987056 RepID=UPI001186C9F8|nr:single-stranded DNA-binding protein [Rhodoligotrophos appendicifer]
MAGSLNKVQLIGHLGKAPEIRHTRDGRGVASFSLAKSESWRDKTTDGRKDRTEWHNIVVFTDGLVKIAEQYLKKGGPVYVEGQLTTRTWQDQSGNDRWSTEVVLQGFNATLTMLDGRRDDGGRYDPEQRGLDPDRTAGRSTTTARPSSIHEELDNEVPF